MKRVLFLLFFGLLSNASKAQLSLFEQDTVNAIYITIPSDSLAKMYLLDKQYYMANMVYTNGFVADSVDSIAIRFRGNTSLASQKKSIKVSFNQYNQNNRYKGVRKLNLIGNHNDPTMVREKLFNVCWKKFGLPNRRVSFVNVYINNLYFGLYTNLEEIDTEWLQDTYGNAAGNLYKCSWGADLTYQGTTQNSYKNLFSGSARTYDLQTNETSDNYADLVQLITTINNSSTTNYLTYLDTIFDYKQYLKILALDVATGNWDDYAYNKSNFMLYHDSSSKQFKFLTIDTDNTFGVDWSGIDWSTRNPYLWWHQQESRPLVKKLLANSQAMGIYQKYLDTAILQIACLDSLNNTIDQYQNLISGFAALDSFRTLDYGYSLTDFNDGFSQSIDSHTPYGIKPFLQKRKQFYTPSNLQNIPTFGATVHPNPFANEVVINFPTSITMPIDLQFKNIQGITLLQTTCVKNNIRLPLKHLPNGVYLLRCLDKNGNTQLLKLQKNGE
jgi:hypothetical protein